MALHHPRPLEPAHNGSPSLRHVGMLDLLDRDARPTFIIDTTPGSIKSENGSLLEYWNSAMASANPARVLQLIGRKGSIHGSNGKDNAAFTSFQTWSLAQDVTSKPLLYSGYIWTKVLISSRWNVISAISDTTCASSEPHGMTSLTRKISKPKAPNFDWTDELPPLRLTPHTAWARSIDWASTPLGPMSSWPSQLRSIANLVMQDPRPAVVFYGPELIMIYNEAEIELLGGFHPCIGASARVALASVWGEYFEPIIEKNLAGETVEKTNTPIHMMRSGFMEETYFSLKFLPILDSEGVTVGHYEPLVETVRPHFPERDKFL